MRKSKKLLSLLLSAVMLLGLVPFVELPTAFAAWNGSTPSSQPSTFTVSGNNYYINDEQALAWFAKTVTNGTTYSGKTVYLNADLNMSSATFDGIGTANKSFSGVFQGQGHTISNLKIYRSGDSRAALFNSVSGTVTINNLKLSNVSVSTSGSGGGWHAALVAKVESGSNTTTVSNITVTTASITSKDQTGGIVGYGQAPLTISNCTVTGLTINATDVNAGGIVGISDKAFTISNCSVSGTINGKNRTGGIIGKAEASGNKINNCTVSGTITSSGLHVGGICGNFNNDGSFEFRNCTNNATIQAKQEVAGILGYSKGHSSFYYCTNNGAITGTQDTEDRGVGCAAGILANNEDDELIFDHCINTAAINGKRCSGGICGDTGDDGRADFTYCYNWGAVTDTVARAAGITANSNTGGSEHYYYCINYGNINSKSRTAGIVVGEETALDIYRCANFGNIYGSGDYDCGGICDSNTGTTNECFNMGAVHKASNSSYSIGGISGALGTVTNCYNGGNIYTANHVAGIGAYNVKVSNCYNYGNITNGNHGNYQIRCDNGGSVTNCYYLSTASGTAQSGATAKTAAQLKELSSSLNSSAFVKDTWGINNGFPILKWWRDNYFRFPIKLVDGSTNVINSTYNYNASFTAPARSKTGYTFNGWYTAASGGSKVWGPAATTVTAGVTAPTTTCGMTWNTGANRPYVLTSTNPLTYYAQYTPYTYTVAYNGNGSNGGSTASSSHTYDVAKNLTANGFTRVYTVTYNHNYTGSTNTSAKATYTFKNWNTNSGGTGTSYTNSQSVSNLTATNGATVNLYAQWNSAAVTLPTPTRAGYTFGGWYKEAACTNKVGNGGAAYTPTAAITLFAKWTVNSYSLTYNLNGGTASNPSSYTVEDALTLNNPTKTGYTFKGWSGTGLTGDANNPVTIAKGSTGDRSYTANYTPNTYSVKFNGNGATSGSMSNQILTYDVEKALTPNAYTRAYTVTYKNNNGAADTSATATASFNGWATTASGAKVYNNQQSVKNLTSTNGAVIELYANWTLGSVTLPTPTRNGYTFKGWYSDSGPETFVGNGGASYTPIANATLYAKWEAADYTVSFNANGGEAVPQLSYKITDSKTLPSTSKAGYTFNNWKVTTAAGSWNANATFDAGASVNGKYGSPTLTAQYTPTNYTITYNVDGATSTAQYNIESTGKLPAQEKTGYDFAGWAVSGNTGNWTETTLLPADTALAGRYGDVTLTAQWTPKTYGISYTLGDGASAANQPLSVEHGGSYTFTVTIDEAHDQNMPTVTATGATASQSVEGNVITVSLTNVTGEVTVNVPTTINTYAFTLNGDEGFTSDDKAQTVDYGSTVTFTVTLTEGYTQTAPTVMQGETALTPKTVEGSAYTYEIANVTSDITVDVTATKNQYAVTFIDTTGIAYATGDVFPVSHGDAFRFSVTPAAGYTQTAPAVTVNGAAIEASSVTDGTYNYVIESVTAALTIEATATLNTYTITWNDEDGTLLATTTANHGEIPVYPNDAPTKAATAQYTYTFAGWGDVAEATADATYTASYSFTVNQYTVKFVNEDGSLLKEYTLDYGAMPAYDGDEPTKAATAQYTYTFKDWDKEIVTVEGDATYTATFDATVNEYTVKFVNDGVELQSEVLPYGSEVTYKGEEPTRAATAQYTYSFAGWDNEIVSVTGDATYTATYDSTVNQYTVKFVNDDGALLKEYTLDYGATPAYDGETPEKAADLEFTYTFKDWTPAIAEVTADAVYTASYNKTAIGYLVRFLNDDGAVLQENSLHYGDVPAYTGEIPEKAPTAKFTYTFRDWDKELAAITGDTDFTATYTSTVNEYTVTFKNYDGTVLQSGSVPYDETPEYTAETPTKAADAQYTYTFKAWDPAIKAVDGNAEYTATYKNTVNKYTVKFVNFDGEVLQEESLDYGALPEYKGATPEKAKTAEFTYNFTGWDKTVAEVTGDTTYTAMFDNVTNSYVVKFVNDDGAVLQEETLLYGATPEYKGETPEKAATAQYTYAFKDWGEEIGKVVGDKTYTAAYTATVNEYTVTFKNFDGETLDEQVLAYGTTPVYAGAAPTKAYDEEKHYVFDGWTVEAVTGDATYTATFTGVAHNWNNGAVKTPATCVAEGEMIHTCKDCGATEIRPIAIDPANHAGPRETRDFVAATADEHGYSGDIYCAACGTLLEFGSQIHRTKGACPYCGGYHEGVWGSVVTAIHAILWTFRQLFRIGK